MHQIYSVKLRNVTYAASEKRKFRASYFPYDRFYLFHSEDLASGLVDRMFRMYLLHTYSDKLKDYMNKHIDLVQIVSINSTNKKTSYVKDNTSNNCRVPWHIKDFNQYVLVVPSFSKQVKEEEMETQYAAGYVTSKAYYMGLELTFSLPNLIFNKENLGHPCVFCSQYLVGFQEGKCDFGGVTCRSTRRLYLPKQRLEIMIGDTENEPRILDNFSGKIPD